MSPDGTAYSLVDPDCMEVKHKSLLAQIPSCQPGLTRPELAAKTCIKDGKLRNALTDLLGADLVVRLGSGTRGDPRRFHRKAPAGPDWVMDRTPDQDAPTPARSDDDDEDF